MNDLAGYREAINCAREITAADKRFILDAEQTIQQGKNNRVLTGVYDGQPAVLKFYDDCINRADSRERKRVEAFALAYFQQCPFIPRLLAEYDNAIIMQRVAGNSFTAEITLRINDRDQRTFLEAMGEEIGAAYGHMAAQTLSGDNAIRFCQQSEPARALSARITTLLSRAHTIANAEEHLRPHMDTIELIRELEPVIQDEPLMLYKYDNNFENILINDGHLVALLDFEMCYLGTETLFLGAMLDTMPDIYPLFPNRPSWESIWSGYRRTRGTQCEAGMSRQIILAAMLNHWHRIIETAEQRNGLAHYAPRFASRFPVLKQMYHST
ncbi:MAG: phosphotransferase [bacterium]